MKKIKQPSKKKHQLTITFPSAEAKRIFAEWMSDGGGEQEYYAAMAESKTPSIIFGYHGPEDTRYARDDKRRYGKFLCDDTIRVEVAPKE